MTIAFLLYFTHLFSQKIFTKEQKLKLKEADYYFKITDYPGALKIYRELWPVDSLWPELNHKMGVCIFYSGGYRKASSSYFSRAVTGQYNDSRYYLALCYHLENRFAEEISFLEQYKAAPDKTKTHLQDVERQIEITKRAMEMVNKPVVVKVENMGPVINSRYHEYVPLINADESMLIFTSRREDSTGEQKDPYGEYYEDIYVSNKKDGGWSQPQGISGNLNTITHDACVGLSSDGNTLIMYRTSPDLKGGDLYHSTFEGDKWNEPQKLGDGINTQYNESSACLNTDGNIMYFSSNRPGGQGGKDIYRIVRFMNGEWSLPLNLGPVINSPYDDDSPYLHPDGITLYFSSKGHETMGGYDIFKSVFEDSIWTKPVNLGYKVNTTDDDIYFVLSTGGQRGYFSSGRPGGQGKQDIYMITMPFTESRLVIVKGKVESEGAAADPVRTKIMVTNEATGKMEGLYHSNMLTGKFMMVLSPGERYFLMVKADGYETYEREITFEPEKGLVEAVIVIQLKKK